MSYWKIFRGVLLVAVPIAKIVLDITGHHDIANYLDDLLNIPVDPFEKAKMVNAALGASFATGVQQIYSGVKRV